MKASKTQKKLKEILYPPKKDFETKIKYYTSKGKCPNFTNFFRMPKINNSNLSNEKQKELKMKLGQLQEEISKASLPIRADLSNDFKSIILETDQRKISPFMRLFWEEQQKYNSTYHRMNPDTDVTYQTVNLFSSDTYFIYFISDVPHYI